MFFLRALVPPCGSVRWIGSRWVGFAVEAGRIPRPRDRGPGEVGILIVIVLVIVIDLLRGETEKTSRLDS